ncbi:MAG: D-aminoacyl-tRNA deacylase [Atopostipes suicloacalis]|nr:D-aminoacyl-tRNA deacylase [Atopostipes suicloacalis]
MRAVIQRVSQAKVVVDKIEQGKINNGFLILVGVEEDDNFEDVKYLSRKIANMRIFEDSEGKMNHSLKKVDGEILSVSQFTLHADTKKGNRPSFVKAADGNHAINLYEKLNKSLKKEGISVKTGTFGADMEVSLVNDGPVTILIDSKDK